MIGGLENFVLSLAQEQIKNGHEVSVLTLNRNFIDQKSLPNKENYGKIVIHRISFFGSKRYPLAFSAIKYLKDNEIIHIHGVDFFFDYLTWTKFIHRKKIILHTHGGFFHTKKHLWFKKIFFQTFTRVSAKFCDKIIAISNNDVKFFSKISNNIILVENGVNVELYQVPKKIDRGVLLYVGRIDVHKRIDNLIKTTIQLNKSDLKITLKVIGPDWKGLQDNLLRLIPENLRDRIIFLGSIDEKTLIQEYSKAHLFVSASDYEGFGISAIEAMSSGTLTILNNIDSFESFLTNNKFGSIVDFNDPKNTAQIIKEFLLLPDDQYDILSEDARKFASKFSWGNVEAKIQRIYLEVVK